MSEDRELPEKSRLVQHAVVEAGLTGRVRELPGSTHTAAEAAAALGCEVGAIASSLLFLADDEPLLVMTSGRHRVDPDLVAGTLRVARIVMASAAQVRAITGQAIGGVAPTGHPAPIRTIIDQALREYETIWSAGGTPRTVFPLTFADLVSLTGGAPSRVASD